MLRVAEFLKYKLLKNNGETFDIIFGHDVHLASGHGHAYFLALSKQLCRSQSPLWSHTV